MLKKLRNKKGFTLAELLIVVAIIGVLVAISIPIFTSQLEKAREATDMANLRSAYAECSAAVLTGSSDNSDVTVDSNGDASTTVTLTQKQANWQTADHANMKIGDESLDDIPTSGTVTVKVTHDGVATFTGA